MRRRPEGSGVLFAAKADHHIDMGNFHAFGDLRQAAHRHLTLRDVDHPVFSLPGMAAQERWKDINGVADTWYCGAYWRNGFHEDGVFSALRAVSSMQGRIAEHEARRNIIGSAVPAYV